MTFDPNGNDVPIGRQGIVLDISFLVKDSAIYGIANGLAKAVGLLTLPLLTAHLTVASFGRVDFFLVLQGLLTVTLIMGFDSAMARFFYDSELVEERRQTVTQSLLAQLFQAFLGVAILLTLLLNGRLDLGSGSDSQALFLLVLAQSPVMIVINTAVGVLKWTFRRTEFLILTLGYTVAQAIAWLAAFNMFEVNAQLVLEVSLATAIIFALAGLYLIRSWLVWPSGLEKAGTMLPFAWPVGIVCVLVALSPAVERGLTQHLLGADALGLYAAAAKIAMIMMLLVNAFQTAWGPFSLSIFEQSRSAELFDRVLRGFAALALAFAIAISAAAPFLLHWLAGSQYAAAAPVVLPLALASAVQAIGWILEIGITFSKRSYLNLFAYLVYCVATIAAMLVLGPKFGLVGIAWAVLLGQLVRTTISSLLAQAAYPQKWSYLAVVIQFALALIIATLALLVQSWHGDGAYALIGFVGSAGLVLIALFGCFSRQERSMAKSWLSSAVSGFSTGR